MGFLAKILSSALQKLTLGILLLIVGLAGFGVWIFVREHVDIEERRLELMRALNGQSRQIRAAVADVEVRIAGLKADCARQEQRAREAARIAREVAELQGGLNRFTTPADQLRRNEERMAALRRLEQEALAQAADLQQQINRAEWEREGLAIALGRLDAQVQQVEKQKSRAVHYAREAWTRHGWHLVFVLAAWFLAPPLSRMAAYFLVAPFITARRPFRLGEATGPLPEVAGSHAALQLTLAADESLWVKECYLQSSDESLRKTTRWLLDWRMPFTCLAAGLREMIELRNPGTIPSGHVTCSSQQSAHVELALVSVPAGASLILRPRHLAGLTGRNGSVQAIRRHWRLFTLQAWATGQFRYFEFVGPCRLLLAGSRGVRAERLEWVEGDPVPGRRANQAATMGFTPGLAYRPVRAETFWAYFRGQNPLFDDLFEGRGVFLCQQTSAAPEGGTRPTFGERFRDGLLRIFGL